MKGMKENALECKHNGGMPPLGYDVDPDTRKLIINEKEARAVRLIFDMYTAGKKYTEILNALNEQGYRTKRGRPFGKNSIHNILNNKKYVGIYRFNRTARAQSRVRNHRENKVSEEIIEIPDGVPAKL